MSDNTLSENIEIKIGTNTYNESLSIEKRSNNSTSTKIDELKQLREELLHDTTKKDDKTLTKKRKNKQNIFLFFI